jgi:hypothetical protein
VRRLLHRIVEDKMVGILAPDQHKGLSAIADADRLDETDLAASFNASVAGNLVEPHATLLTGSCIPD